jgi:A/G-specific adenine glycosylase
VSFAYNEPRAFVETNIRAVFIHRFFPGRTKVSDAEIMPLVEATLDARNPRHWFYALMDYGVALKRSGPDPSRRSAHYAKQGRFEGSDREARGLVVKALARPPARARAARGAPERDAAARGMSVAELARTTGLGVGRVRAVLPGLVRDGLVARRGGRLGIA